ncbi:MAG: GNAT family N-acetyltransferase [Candidatus Zixiibacteriota bacterium]|nr:MAG: GNAT family N-acetyltransferase [candidate division Zixibacteria bacterium]
MQYQIRKLKVDDYYDLIALWVRSDLEHRPGGRDSREAIRSEMKREETIFLGMFDGDKMIGSILGSSDGRKGWINRLAVDPDYRGKGLAGILIEECEKYLYDLGLKVIAALIEGDNKPSESAFSKAGYTYGKGIKYYSKRFSDED